MSTRLAPGEILRYEAELASRDVGSVPGTVIEDILVPARGFMRARRLDQGQSFRVIDLEGQQVVDMLLYDADNLKNVSSMTNTLMMAGRWKLTVGDGIFAKLGQRMALIADESLASYQVIGGFCNPEINEARYGVEGTHTCRMNFVASMAAYDLTPNDIEEGCFGVFINLQYEPDGTLEIRPPQSKPGDYVDFAVEMPVLLALSNCPSEHNPCNGWNPTPIRVIIYRTSEENS